MAESHAPDTCGYAIHVAWPDGTTSSYEGIGLTVNDLILRLIQTTAEISLMVLVDPAGPKVEP